MCPPLFFHLATTFSSLFQAVLDAGLYLTASTSHFSQSCRRLLTILLITCTHDSLLKKSPCAEQNKHTLIPCGSATPSLQFPVTPQLCSSKCFPAVKLVVSEFVCLHLPRTSYQDGTRCGRHLLVEVSVKDTEKDVGSSKSLQTVMQVSLECKEGKKEGRLGMKNFRL